MKRRAIVAVVAIQGVLGCTKGEKKKTDAERCDELTEHVGKLVGKEPSEVRESLAQLCMWGTDKQRACILGATAVEELATNCRLRQFGYKPPPPPVPQLTCPDGATQHAPVPVDGAQATWCERAGQRHGLYVVFGSGGASVTATYKHGVLDGELSTPSGGGMYRAGKRHGVWKTKELEMTLVDGVAEGPYTEKVGDQAIRGAWSKGKRSGIWNYESSIATWSGAYADGKRDGLWTVKRHGADTPTAEGTYKAGRRQDDWKYWNSGGQPIEEKAALEAEWLGGAIDVDAEPVESLDVLLGPDPK